MVPTVTASRSARNLGVVLDDQLDFKEQVAATSWSCRFLLYNIRRIRLYLTTYSTQLLVQAMVISRLDYCNSLLASLPACVIQPLQLIQNAAARLVFNLPKFSHVTPLLRSLHWLPVAARIRFKVSGLCCSQQDGPSLPTGHHSGLHTSSTTPLCCHRLPCPSCQPCNWLSLVPTGASPPSLPQWWNDLPIPIRTAPSLPIFRRSLKTHLFTLYLDSSSGVS